MAAASNIGKWSGQASLDAGPWVAGINRVEKSAAGLEGRLEKIFGGISAAVRFPGFAVGFESFTVGAAVQAGRQFVESFAETVDENLELGFLADELGTSVEWLSTLETVALESSIAAGQFGSMMHRLNVTMGAARQGGEAQQAIFQRLGLDWQRITEQGFDRSFIEIANAMMQVENRTERARIATELFGREGGRQALRLMNDAQARMQEAHGRGAFITEAGLRQLQEADDAMDRVSTRWSSVWREFVVTTAPAITRTFSLINEVLRPGEWSFFDFLTNAPQRPPLPASQQADTRNSQQLEDDAVRLEQQRRRMQRIIAEQEARVEETQRQRRLAAERGDGTYGRLTEFLQSDLEMLRHYQERLAAMSQQEARDADRWLQIMAEETEAINAEIAARDELLAQQRESAGQEWLRRWQQDQDEVARITEQTARPMESFEHRMQLLSRLFAEGELTAEMYGRATVQALERIGGSIPEARLPGSFDLGSRETISLINQNLANRQQTAAEYTRQLLDLTRQRDDLRRQWESQVLDELRNAGVAVDVMGAA